MSTPEAKNRPAIQAFRISPYWKDTLATPPKLSKLTLSLAHGGVFLGLLAGHYYCCYIQDIPNED